jgi:hypothetical protein
VTHALEEARRRRNHGFPAREHPLIRIGKILAGLSERLKRAGREPIREPERAQIRAALAGLDAVAEEYEVLRD